MRKKAITKPVFGKIFIVRFLILLVAFAFIAGYAYSRVYNIVYEREIYQPTANYRNGIEDIVEAMANEEPGSDEYEKHLNNLRQMLAVYQMVGYNYAEVNINNLRIATDEDVALFLDVYDAFAPETANGEYYFIEDMSYLEPYERFLRENGLRNEKQDLDNWYRKGRDPLTMWRSDFSRSRWIESVYINREKHTFLPGIIRLSYIENEYKIDCTPADTKGYEYVEFSSEDEKMLLISYRVAPDLSSKDIDLHIVPGKYDVIQHLDNDTYNNPELYGIEYEKTWEVGFNAYKKENVFIVAPYSSAIITAIYLVISAITALIFSVIKYQKDKTVWEIFDYRTRTTEAMAHDLKTPLSTIMFYLENLEESSKEPDKVLEYTKNINDKVVTMDHMIGDILLLSRNESGKIVLNIEEISLKELVTESLKEFPDMETDIKGDDITLTTDRKVLSQVIMNLLSNCDRYKEKDSVVYITISPEALTLINKTDRTYDDVESLKKPFVKGEDSRGNKGTGLGLAVADNNLAILGYKLELASEQNEFRTKVIFKP